MLEQAINRAVGIGFEEKRGNQRYSSIKHFTDSTWCTTADGLFPLLFSKRSPAFVTDISAGGLSFLCTKDIKIGTQISVIVAYKEYRTFQLNGRIRSCHKVEAGSNAEVHGTSLEYHRASIQFLYNETDASSELTRLLQRLQKQD